MCTALTPANSVLFGNTEHLNVSRALSELQARRPIRVEAPGEVLFALPVEGLDDQRLHEFMALCSPNAPDLIVTQQRARAIGIEASTPMALPLPEGARARDIFVLAADAENKGHSSAKAEAAGRAAMAAVQIAKLSRGLPAVLAAKVTNINSDLMHSIVAVEADAIERFAASATKSLAIASEASIPLASGTAARFVVFRDTLGVDQVAIIVGKPNFTEPVPVRLHSACLTGDVFGSRRCDCGDRFGSRSSAWKTSAAGHSVLGSGGPRHWSCEQDARLSIAGRGA